MDVTTRNGLTAEARFFLEPEGPLQRQYEAFRAYFVEALPSREVARRFGYSPGSFRVLCHQFRHDSGKGTRFFQPVRHGTRDAPARDPIRDLAVAMRKRNLSVYDIQRELAAGGHAISVNALAVLLRAEGFARLPRRRDDERPDVRRPEIQAAADVRRLDLEPRSFRTSLGGLFLFLPLMKDIRLQEVLRQAELPGSIMVPSEQALRTLLALKLIGKERKSHVMDLVCDPGIALFAGLNVVPKRSYLASYSSRVDRRACVRLMAAWFDEVRCAGLPRGDSIDVDFHSVPANTTTEPLEKHYISSRSRSQTGVLVFLARDAQARVMCYAHAGVPKADKAAEVLRFAEFWRERTGHQPAELVFDSQLTTLPSLTRAFRTPKVLDERIKLPGYEGKLRQISIIDLGHEEPTILLTNNTRESCPTLVTRYAQRMLIENGISEAIQFFHLDALSSMVGMKVDFDLQITLMASSLYRLLAERIGREYRQATAKTMFRNLLDVSATVEIRAHEVVVSFDKRAHNPYLVP